MYLAVSTELTATWRKSSFSGGNGGQCVEVASLDVDWRKSSYSGANGGNCVEVADLAPVVGVRDSKNPAGPALLFAPAAWAAFLADVKAGRLAG